MSSGVLSARQTRQLHHTAASGVMLCLIPSGFDFGTACGTIRGMIMALKNDRGRVLISCREAAELYPCSMRYIRKLCQAGRLPFEEVGGTYMVDRAEVMRLANRDATGREAKRSEGFTPG